MGAQQKPKVKRGERNDARPNGKARKQRPKPSTGRVRSPEAQKRHEIAEARRKQANYLKRTAKAQVNERTMFEVEQEMARAEQRKRDELAARKRASTAKARAARSRKIIEKVNSAK